MAFFVYILASKRNGTLYIGSTEGLENRITEHKAGTRPGFTSKYGFTCSSTTNGLTRAKLRSDVSVR
jgi:putative endonuclease